MPFKSGKSPSDAAKNIKSAIDDEQDNIKQALTDAVWGVKNASDYYVPMDTGDLQQSGEVNAPIDDNGVYTVTLGYYIKYAEWLYDNPNWRPAQPDAQHKRGPLVNPNARNRWVEHGLQDFDFATNFKVNMQ